jgi:hypothetical protein
MLWKTQDIGCRAREGDSTLFYTSLHLCRIGRAGTGGSARVRTGSLKSNHFFHLKGNGGLRAHTAEAVGGRDHSTLFITFHHFSTLSAESGGEIEEEWAGFGRRRGTDLIAGCLLGCRGEEVSATGSRAGLRNGAGRGRPPHHARPPHNQQPLPPVAAPSLWSRLRTA